MVRFANNGTLIGRSERIELPPEIEQVADLLGKQRPEVRDLFHFACVQTSSDDEKARVVGTRAENEQEWLTIETVAGDVFEIVRPPMSEEREAELMKQVRVTVQEESGE